ncbi:MAG: dockerin type I domain-containing protein [Candidatus Baldrarchaeia archaeon]
MWAYAWSVPGEADTVDNTYMNGWIFISIASDVDASGRVDMIDLWLIQKHFGALVGTPNYVPNYDVDSSGRIDMIDLWITQNNFGQIDP